MQEQKIILKKVRVHNLKGVDLTLQNHQLIVFTGVSGSGKSSLAFDTIYAEGQRRYIESLSHQARRYLSDLPKPEAESISGISPTIAIEQKLAARTPRSTVGTITGIYDHLRVLFARVAIPHCPISGDSVEAHSREKIIKTLQLLAEGKKLLFLSPYAKQKKSEFKEDFADFLKKGYMRVRVDGTILDLSEIDKLDGKIAHDVDIVIDRLTTGPEHQSRIAESATQALEIGKGFFSIFDTDTKEEVGFSQFAYSPKSGKSYGPLEPQNFSFNHPSGACEICGGMGSVNEFDLDKIIDPEKSIAEDCCIIAPHYETVRYGNIFNNLARLFKFKVTTPWKNLSENAKKIFLYGTEQKWIRMRFVHPNKGTRWTDYVRWQGVLHEAHQRLQDAKSDKYRQKMAEMMTHMICPSCHGSRIKAYPSAARLAKKKIHELTSMTIEDCAAFFSSIQLSKADEKIARELIREIERRLQFLLNVGLGYLTMERISPTLSGGESQRVRLASQIGAGLVGTTYVLDEPSIGLHATDHSKLVDTLQLLRDQGNTVIVVEHDEETIRAADKIIDVGPGAGKHGGEIVAQGTLKDICKNPKSLTGQYLSHKKTIALPKKRRAVLKSLKVLGAKHNNLKNITVEIPLETMVCITGVSGSGKSSLISDILYPALANHLHRGQHLVGKHKKIEGIDKIDKIIAVDQSPIGRTPRSNAATYIKLLDDIRSLFTQLPESKMRGYKPGHFSFNVKEGSCSYCSGLGTVRIDMDFMEDVWVECMQCKGRRFDPEILSIQYSGKNIYEVLSMDVESALEHFSAIPHIFRKLELLKEVGLNYLQIGQPSTTLSGGEAQRIKLAKELVRPDTGKTLYIFDEPTTGLHFHDISKLIGVLQKLVDHGNSVLVIEHNLDFIKNADWLIDLGPGAGTHGGQIIGQGTPEEISELITPTGQALRSLKKIQTVKREKTRPIDKISITNAEQNNLKHIHLSIPHNQITVFTGPSGSGKSSLAFETIYAEGQRRYIESLPPYARQFVKLMPKPKIEQIEGLAPAIAIEQKAGGINPRSTVGTLTEVYDLLRILYAHLGTPFCPETNEEIRTISKEYVVEKVLKLPEKEKIQILAPLRFHRNETFEDLMQRLNREGFLRIRLNGEYYEIDQKIPFEMMRKNELLLVIDRLMISKSIEKRLYEAVEKAAQISDGIIIVAQEKKDLFFNLAFAVPSTGKSYRPITPQTFSFNSEQGMCMECQGLGTIYGANFSKQLRLLRRNIYEVANYIFGEFASRKTKKLMGTYFENLGIDPYLPISKLSSKQKEIVFHGSEKVAKTNDGLIFRWIGINAAFARAAKIAHAHLKQPLIPFMHERPCPSCTGTRLNELARHVKIENTSITEYTSYDIAKSLAFMKKCKVPAFLEEVHANIIKYLNFLCEIGLHYLSLNRSAPTLSGGELQRIRLAKQLGSGLTSCFYMLDEPTIGLHPHNSALLQKALVHLRDLGNTLILVEHDPSIIKNADYIVDFGPGAGNEGGMVTAKGTYKEILKNSCSLTGQYLSGKKSIPIPKKRRNGSTPIIIENAKKHNLKNLTLKIPTECITCFTGVSGSGKSTLLFDILQPAAKEATRTKRVKNSIDNVTGLNAIDKLIVIDQNPIGQTIRSDVSTYSDVLPFIRQHYASLKLAKAKGLQPRHFSYNHRRGMCKTCFGLGYKSIDLQFLPSVRVTCEACHGYRLNPISLEVTYKNKHLGQLLKMTVKEARNFFDPIARIARKLDTLISVGLDYLQLGQEITSLSGGEAQRIRLAKELSKRSTGKTLYLIDEPTIGLHSEDVVKLLKIFHKLADKKNTLMLIEHNLDVVANADYIFDLGPEAGDKGGKIVVQGTPEKVAKHPQSYTAQFLQKTLNP